MTSGAESPFRSPTAYRLTLLVALGVYGVLTVAASRTHLDRINPDAVSYLRHALYLTEGRLYDSISGYWSPVLSWCTAPLMAAGMEGLHAARVVLAMWGVVLIVAAYAVIRRWTSLPAGLAMVALVLVAETTVRWATTVFPDIIMAACLMGYCAVLLRADFAERRSLQVLCGVWAGVAFLGKAYALPFFVVHFPVSLALLYRLPPRVSEPGRGTTSVPRLSRVWMMGMVGFLTVSLPWIVALSVKYRQPTFGLVGPINHAIIGPDFSPTHGLWSPVAGRVTQWEIPESRDYEFWSPLDSAAHFKHQVDYSWQTVKRIRTSLARFDYLSLSLALLAIAPFLMYALGRSRELVKSAWVVGTIAVFCSGYPFVYFTYRYTYPFLKPLFVVASFQFAFVLGQRIRETGPLSLPARELLRWALLLLLTLSFSAQINLPFEPYTVMESGGTRFNDVTVDSRPHRELAARLGGASGRGPIASTLYWAGIYVGYYADRPFLGSPDCRTVEACNVELRGRDVGTFLVDRRWELADEFRYRSGWTLEMTVEPVPGEVVDVYTPSSSTR